MNKKWLGWGERKVEKDGTEDDDIRFEMYRRYLENLSTHNRHGDES
jgi:hypothetical protein